MGYIPPRSLENLKKYSYKGVDRCVYDSSHWSMELMTISLHFRVYRSLTSRYVLNRYWTWFVTLWPLSVAPNTVSRREVVWGGCQESWFFWYLQITLTGLTIVFFNFLTMIYYDPMYLTEKQGAAGPPHWVYFTYVRSIIIIFPCCSPVVKPSLQMGHRLVSVSKLGCYRWVGIHRLTSISLQISHKYD